MLLLLIGCTGTSAPAVDCPPCEACGESNPVLEPWEAQVLAPVIEDLRQGVRPFADADSFGVCVGATECDSYLGLEPEPLQTGDHMILAELSVPSEGEGWSARFRLDCTVQTPAGRETTVDFDKTYPLVHTGAARGYMLKPIWRIQSPHPQGSRDCTYKLFSVRPDGQETEAATGHYATAMPPKE